MADDHDGLTVEVSQSAHDSFIIFEIAVAVQFDELLAHLADVVEGIGAFGVAGELDFLPAGEVAVDLFASIADLGFELFDHGLHIDLSFFADLFDLIELFVELFERFFKFEEYHNPF